MWEHESGIRARESGRPEQLALGAVGFQGTVSTRYIRILTRMQSFESCSHPPMQIC
jgi:hypothetical protein